MRSPRLAALVVLVMTSACAPSADVPESSPSVAESTTIPSPGSSTAETTSASAAPVPTAPPASPTTGAGPTFSASISPIDAALTQRMKLSWRVGCPVPLSDLRYLRVSHWDMTGQTVVGELVVHEQVATQVVQIFKALYAAAYPIRSLRLVDDFDADDDTSMAADNSSAFNCRQKTGGGGWSNHSYGRAIDLNPVENPYVSGSLVLPPAGSAYVDRVAGPGVIVAGDAVVKAFAAHGWAWGGSWTSPVDYQHFEV